MDNQEQIWAYIDGKMSNEERHSFEALMQSDHGLKLEFENIFQINSILSSEMKWSAPNGIEAKIIKNLETKTVNREIDFLPIKYLWLAISASIGLMTIILLFSNAGTAGTVPEYLGILENLKLQQNYTVLLESCKTYIYLSFFCAAIFTFALTLDQFKWQLLSTRNYKL